jgi:hypothetical protein
MGGESMQLQGQQQHQQHHHHHHHHQQQQQQHHHHQQQQPRAALCSVWDDICFYLKHMRGFGCALCYHMVINEDGIWGMASAVLRCS